MNRTISPALTTSASAGTYFHSNRHELAVADYERARELGFDEDEVLPLLADALLHSGRFAAAAELWSGWEPREARYDRVMGIVGLAATTVIDVTGLHEQRRRPLTDDEIASIGEAVDPEICRGLLQTADALSPQLWLDLLPALPEANTLGGLVLAAHVAVDRPELWALASLIAMAGAPDDRITRQLIDSGVYLCGAEYLEAARSIVGAPSSDGVLGPQHLAVIEHRIATRPDDGIEPVVRIHVDEAPPEVPPAWRTSGNKRRKSRKVQKQSRRKNR